MKELTNAEVINAYANIPQQFIEDFGEEGDLARQYLLNPTIFALLGEVSGKRILDAGCGQGYLCRLLAKQEAQVTGLEPSDAFFTYACQREQDEPLGIDYVQADLSTWEPVPNTFDAVIANMVLMDIPDFLPALHHLVAALKRGGQLLLSLLHPCFEEPGDGWKTKGYVEVRNYFRERAVPQRYGSFIHRPLSTYLNRVIEAGCTIQRIIEPQLEENIARQYDAERYHDVPGYIVISALKPS
jgi:2-polyprenyl-3-methyl-5-hydroxy-6-metoxy-1,4-benzoquinol methylase